MNPLSDVVLRKSLISQLLKGLYVSRDFHNAEQRLVRLFYFLPMLLMTLAGSLYASTQQAPGSGIPVPTGIWTLVLTRDLPASTNGWEQLVYAPAIQGSIMLSQYHQTNSEPNESLVVYNFDTNDWEVLDMGGLVHTENIPEGGESQGYFGYDPALNSLVYHCCTSGSNQAEDVNHTWWYDVVGQSGRDEQTPLEPPSMALQPGGAFDVAHNVFVMFGGASYTGTWLYNPGTNSWQQQNVSGTPPDPSIILPSVAYSSAAQQIYLFGGKDGSIYYQDIFTYNVPTNTWTKISPVGGVKPPGRLSAGFAYDSTNNVFLLYGGQGASGVLGDTWIFNPVTNAWTQLSPALSPPITAPDYARLTYDSDHNAFVLAHKAPGGYFGGNWGALPVQTWLFRYQGAGPNAATLINTTQPVQGSINRNLVSWAKDPVLATSGNSLYVSWAETGSPFATAPAPGLHIFADQYSGGNWVGLGSTYASISTANVEAHAPSLAVVGSAPWISWYQSNSGSTSASQIYAASWNGAGWQGTGAIGLVGTTAVQGRSQLANVAGSPYLAFIEVNKSTSPQSAFAYVKSWNGNSWALQGGVLNHSNVSGSIAASISIASDGIYPYVAWTEYVRGNGVSGGLSFTNPQVYVSHWNGTQWTQVGGSLNQNASSGWANDASIAYFNGQPYVAWTERTQTGNNQLYVANWNGASWIQTSATSLNRGGASGWAYHPSLAVDQVGNNLYIAWVEQTALGQKAQVFVSQFISGSWASLGGALNADQLQGSAQRVSLGVANGQPVAAWGEVDYATVRQVYVSQWSGSSWTQLPAASSADTTPPTTPSKLVATAVSSSQINLAWAGSTDTVGVSGYYIFRNGSNVGAATSTVSFQDTGLVPSTTYSYTVAAYDAAGNISARSKAASATTSAISSGPSVSITAPNNGAVVSGTITVSANATDSAGMSNVQFQIDGANLGNAINGPGPSYSTSWNTATAANGNHTVTAIATDINNNTASASVGVVVNNSSGVEPVISNVSATSVTSSGATITWTTDEPSTSQVAYGLTSSYGSLSSLNQTLVTSHSVSLSGLAASTTYHNQVISQDASGNTNSSGDNTFTTAAKGLQTLLEIQANTAEVSGITNGSLVTPTVAPTGFTGTVVVNGISSVNFTPAQSGNGVYFLNCCTGANDAFFQFTGAGLGNIFTMNQGEISFFLQSRYSYAQRKSQAASPRYAFDVRDGSNNHLFYFFTEVTAQGLQFAYATGGNAQFYYVPAGTEDTLYGSGITMQVTLTWNGTTANLYLNNNLVKSANYLETNPNWNSGSTLDFGAYQYQNIGGYNVSDDVVGSFVVQAP